MRDRGRRLFRTLDDAGVAIRTMGRLINVHRSNIRVCGETRGFHERHWPRLQFTAELVSALPRGVLANEWLRTPHPGLSGRSPLDLISAYGADAPIPSDLPQRPSTLEQMSRRRWWVTFLALVEVPGESLEAALDHLRATLPQPGEYAEEMLTVDVRWAWSPGTTGTTFAVAEVGALHLPGLRADRRWDPYTWAEIRDSPAWYGQGYAQPLREALLTHWHTESDHAFATASLNDSPVPLDEYDRWMFTHRRMIRPSSPPWEPACDHPIVRYLSRIGEAGPPVPHNYRPFPGARDGSKAEVWMMRSPFAEDYEVFHGSLSRYPVSFLDRSWINTVVCDGDGIGYGGSDPRAIRMVNRPAMRP